MFLTNPFEETASLEDLLADPSVSYEEFSGIPTDPLVQIPISAIGRYVRIQRYVQGILHVAEIEVFGCSLEAGSSSQRFAQANEEVSENLLDPTLQAFPNPFSQTIQLVLEGDWGEQTQIGVYNSLGQKLFQQKAGENQVYEVG